MFYARLKMVGLLLLVAGMVGGGVGLMSYRTLAAANDPPEATAPSREEKLKQENAELKKELHRMQARVAALEARLASQDDHQVFYKGKSVSSWLKQLKDTDPSYRADAVQALGSLAEKNQNLIPALMESLKDVAGVVREQAIVVLSPFAQKDRTVIPALLGSLKDEEKDNRVQAIRVLIPFAQKDKAIIPALMESLKDRDPGVRMYVLWALINLDPTADAAIPAILETWKSDYAYLLANGFIHPGTARRLMRIDPEGTVFVPLFIQALKNSNDNVVRQGAWQALYYFGPKAKAAIPVLAEIAKEFPPNSAGAADIEKALKAIRQDDGEQKTPPKQ